ncbi:MAG: ATP synthase F0 subunit B [Desulfobacterales bacterium]|jgi:F-type H+-transporting ATPase subunit b
MKVITKIAEISYFILAVVIGILLLGTEASAANNSDDWRPTFDLVMRWLNFGIIVFILVKYARTPVKNFLLNRRAEVAREIEMVEEKKEAANKKIEEAARMLDESEVRFAKVKERIIQEGETKKQKLIEDAKQESKILLESTRKKIDNQLLDAQKAFKSELVDAAISMAMKRLPDEITTQDNQNFTNQFLASASGKKN